MSDQASDNKWRPIATAPEGIVVWTMICNVSPARNKQRLRRRGGRWFFPDGKMYIYYEPTHWRPLEEYACPTK